MKSPAVWGAVAGLGTVSYMLLCYWMSPSLMVDPVVTYSSWLIFLLCMAIPLLAAKNEEHPLHFRTATRLAFIVYLVANLIFYVFDFTMKKYVDPGLVAIIQEQMRESIDSGLLQSLGQEGKNLDFTPTFSSYLLNFAQSLIMGFGLAALLALIFKNNNS